MVLYDAFIRLIFLHSHRETSPLAHEPEGIGSVSISSSGMRDRETVVSPMVKPSVSRSLIPLPRFIRSRHPTPFLVPSLVLFPPLYLIDT